MLIYLTMTMLFLKTYCHDVYLNFLYPNNKLHRFALVILNIYIKEPFLCYIELSR